MINKAISLGLALLLSLCSLQFASAKFVCSDDEMDKMSKKNIASFEKFEDEGYRGLASTLSDKELYEIQLGLVRVLPQSQKISNEIARATGFRQFSEYSKADIIKLRKKSGALLETMFEVIDPDFKMFLQDFKNVAMKVVAKDDFCFRVDLELEHPVYGSMSIPYLYSNKEWHVKYADFFENLYYLKK